MRGIAHASLCVNLDSVIFGQSKDLVIPMSIDQYRKLNLILDYESPHGYNLLRGEEKTFTNHQQSVLDDIQFLEDNIKTYSTDNNYLTDLLTDLSGQVKQAFSRYDWFSKWGIHYLPSITRMDIYF